MPAKYKSLRTCGVDTKEYYLSLGTSITKVNEATGISRASITAVPIHAAAPSTVRRVLEFLESNSSEIYEQDIAKARKDYERIVENVESAWTRYMERETLLDQRVQEYGLERKKCVKKKVEMQSL